VTLYFFVLFFLVLISLFMLCYAFNLLMAFDRLLLKGLLTYLLNSHPSFSWGAWKKYWGDQIVVLVSPVARTYNEGLGL